MDEFRIRATIKEEIANSATNNQYNQSKVPVHTHNGTDSVPILQKNIVNNNKYSAGIGSVVTETYKISNLPNIAQIFFNGIAANNAADLSLPGTLKATITGVVQFGNCYNQIQINSLGNEISFSNIVSSFSQSTSSMYIDTTSLANARVAVSAAHFAYVINAAGVVVASSVIDSYTNSQITISTTLAATWAIQGSFIMI